MAKTPDNRPWAPHPIPSWVIKEFTRRKNDIGLEYPINVTWDDNGTWQNYKGPMTAWVRVFSNGTGKVNDRNTYPEKSGFILQGGYGFDNSYGIPDNKNILGYDSEGEPHTLNLSPDGNLVSFPNSISNDKRTVQKFLPVPGITSIDAVVQKERIRKITVNWRCYGYAQLEYMTPYFLSPKISAFVEFGWNHFNPTSLLDLRTKNLKNLKELFTSNGYLLYDENIKKSFGLYDGTMGIVSSFDFSTQDGIIFECKTEILSKHANYSGVLVNGASKTESDKEKTSVQSSFASYLEKRVTKLPVCIKLSKNFFDPLDDEEEKKKLLNEFIVKDFYLDENGNKKVEDRFFVGRKSEYGDSSYMNGMSSYDWDKSDQKDVWVTFGFLVELANLFFKQPIDIKLSDVKPFDLYEIDSSDVVIGSHPNLISCDGNVLLIPNQKSPKFNAGNYYPTGDAEDNDYQKQLGFGNNNIFSSEIKKIETYNSLSPYNRTVAKVLKTGIQVRPKSTNAFGFGSITLYEGESKLLGLASKVETTTEIGTGGAILRDNLDGIINRFRYTDKIGNKNKDRKKLSETNGTKSFPRWDIDEPISKKPKGYWGNLNDLYVSTKVIIECAKSADTVENFYNTLLNKISNASGKIWDLSVIEDDHKLKIIDKKFIQYNDLKIYQFDVGSSNNFIKNISFTAQLSNVAANQVISSASSNKSNTKSVNGTINSNQILLFPYGDRFNLVPPTSSTGSNDIQKGKSQLIDNNLEVIRQLQNSPQNSTTTNGSYIMSFKVIEQANRAKGIADRKQTGWNIVNLVLPNETLLIALLNDLDFKNNTNVYGGQQPGFTVEMTLQGISGLRTFQLFSLKNLPSPYSESEIMCQIVDISHKIENGNWTTVIKAGIRSIRGQQIKITTDGINERTINVIE